MSMINQMLKDLDQRQATAGDQQPVTEGVLLASPARRSRQSPLLVLVLVAAVAAGIGAWAWSQYHKPGAPAPAVQVAAVTALPKAEPVPVQPVPASASSPSPIPSVPVTQAASESLSKPSEPAAKTPQTAKPEAVAVRKDPVSAPVVTATRESDAKVSPEQAAAKPATTAMTTGKATRTPSAEVLAQAKPEPKSPAVQPSSFKVVNSKQQSENSYRHAVSLLQQSRVAEARQALRQAIAANSANHDARLLLAGLLVDANNNAEAAALLGQGLEIVPGHSGFSIALARLQVANGRVDEALSTMEKGVSSAGGDAEYHAYLAALLQKQGRHDEAVQHYITALRSNPSMPSWLIGVGISLQAINKTTDATEAFQRAIDTAELTPEVARFAGQQLKQIREQR